jgi:hypothetical protein
VAARFQDLQMWVGCADIGPDRQVSKTYLEHVVPHRHSASCKTTERWGLLLGHPHPLVSTDCLHPVAGRFHLLEMQVGPDQIGPGHQLESESI